MSKYKIGYFDDIVDVDDYIERNGEFISNSEIVDILNEQEEEIKELEKCREKLFIRERDTKNECRELKERNQRQYERLKELTELMYERQWGKLENMVDEWEKEDELLQAEWRDY